MKLMKRVLVFLSLFSALAFIANASDASDETPPPPGVRVAEVPTHHVGERWKTNFPESGKSSESIITRVTPEGGYEVKNTISGTITTFTAEMNKTAGPGPNGQPSEYRPHNYNLVFPLWPGKVFGGLTTITRGSSTYQMTVQAKVREWSTLTIKVDGKEKTVDVLVIDYVHQTGSTPNTGVAYYSPEFGEQIRFDSSDRNLSWEKELLSQ